MNRWAPFLAIFALCACEPDTYSWQEEQDGGQPPPAEDASLPDSRVEDARVGDARVDDARVEDAWVQPASEPVYINTGESLYAYDPVSGDAALIGDFETGGQAIDDMVDIAIDLQGRMYGGTTQRELFRVDPRTAECTFLAEHDDILHGLTFLSDGRLVVAGHRVVIIDPASGRVLDELVPEGVYETSGDIIGLPDARLYWSVRGGSGQDDLLVRVDPRTHSTTELGSTGVQAIYGLGFADGVLYGFLRDGALVALDQSDGRATSESPLEGRWYGATTNPVLW